MEGELKICDKAIELFEKHQKLIKNVEEFSKEGINPLGKINLESKIERLCLLNQRDILSWVLDMGKKLI